MDSDTLKVGKYIKRINIPKGYQNLEWCINLTLVEENTVCKISVSFSKEQGLGDYSLGIVSTHHHQNKTLSDILEDVDEDISYQETEKVQIQIIGNRLSRKIGIV